ncbi:uncharacterized protein DSM5745_04838 [Aspergillus mulundensis]|uniref:Uncharacterized protein n=1 Tax=Aspergillus mulundensis TaxID=1810919 RepID=A0A3D8S599_9EURO|nr:hypothetical protein DSM5745_04838 [Aspergillus mulundensis]RDW81281.1 hypothetical protein DSM5745_04838 [Aspergillus mulundensis]
MPERPAYRDVSSPFPDIRVALIRDVLRVFSVPVTVRIRKHFSDRGIVGRVRDAVLVDFIEFVLRWEYSSRELDKAWENYSSM